MNMHRTRGVAPPVAGHAVHRRARASVRKVASHAIPPAAPTARRAGPSLTKRFNGQPVHVRRTAAPPPRRDGPSIVASLSRTPDGRTVVAAALAGVEADESATISTPLDTPLDSHPNLVRGRLDNGLEYVILPNKSPPQRFEAHLQVHVGSVDESEKEQGIAHFVEHITFLGSRKREMLLGTGARSNAYTDFQHTVFHVHSAMYDMTTGRPMLPQVISALTEVAFEAEFLKSRIEKERKAVLAEAQMMNTIEYRIDCQLLRYLHGENMLGYRFPIGKVDQVKAWSKEELHNFWKKWYFPANATLYIVGDLNTPQSIQECVSLIQTHFGKIPKALDTDGSVKERLPVRPPVKHNFGCGNLREEESKPCEVSMFRHPLVSNYMLSIFSKLPIHEMNTLQHVKELLIFRILVSVYHRRIGNRYAESDAAFHSILFEIADSSREGSCVASLTITSEPKDWEEATRVAIQEAQRMAQHGVTQSELQQYLEALLNDGSQLAASVDSQAHIEVLELIMECICNGQVVNSNTQAYETMLAVANSISIEDVNAMARSYLSFIADYGREGQVAETAAAPDNAGLFSEPGPIRTTSIIACVPMFVSSEGEGLAGGAKGAGGAMSTGGHLDGSHVDVDAVKQPGEELEEEQTFEPPPGSVKFKCSDEDIQRVLLERHAMEPLEDVQVPDYFISPEELEGMLTETAPEYVAVKGREGEGPLPAADATSGVVQRRLSNGVTLNYKVSDNDPGSSMMRVCASGGRAAEPSSGAGPMGVGSLQVGMRTMSESGTVGDCKREEVEMFCLSRLINCMIDTDPENVFIDWHFQSGPDGLRGVFEIVHLMVERPSFNEKAFQRAKTAVESAYRSVSRSLERSNYDRILQGIFGEDRRMREPEPAEIDALTLDGVREMVRRYMRPDNIEVTVIGDFDPAVLEDVFMKYMGSIPARTEPLPLPHVPVQFQHELPLESRHQVWHLPDSDERGIGNIAGLLFRRWGDMYGSGPVEPVQGRLVSPPQLDDLNKRSKTDLALAQTLRRAHPLFPPTVLLMIQDIVNARLFATVRDQLNLTYDVSFEITQFDRLNTCFWCINVTATPGKIADATQASLQVMRDLKLNQISWQEVERTRQLVLTRHESDLKDNHYIINLVTHLQAQDVPLKTIDCLRDLPYMIRALTAQDLNDAFALFGLNDDEIFTSIGTSGPEQPSSPPALKLQAGGDADQFAARQGQGRNVTDTLMQAMANAMLEQMRRNNGSGESLQQDVASPRSSRGDSSS